MKSFRSGRARKKRVVVVGGGAAGLIAAGTAALFGANVVILEKTKELGKKLSITGKGRCNISNSALLPDFIEHFGKNGRFLRQSFNQFFSEELMAFFKKIGINTVVERGGRIFPKKGNAQDVVSALVLWNEKLGVKIKTDLRVRNFLVSNNKITGIKTTQKIYETDTVILATGGKSYPATGSTGDGFSIARSVGHTVIPTRPALVPLVCRESFIPKLDGLVLKNVLLSVWVDNKKIQEIFGEMLFTSFGISGPIVLSVSKLCVDTINSGKQVYVSIDLKPALDRKSLDVRLLRDIDKLGAKKLLMLLKGLLPVQLIQTCCEVNNFSADKLCHQINSKERKKLLNWLKDFRLNITQYRPFKEAIVTAGGVNVKEIDPKTMRSKIVKNLFFAGEIMDIDGDTGGYNLQAAFSTGYVAGKYSADKQSA